MQKNRIIDFMIFMTVAAIISTGSASYILYQTSKVESFALQVSHSNWTTESLRYAIETEIEDNIFYSSQNKAEKIENWQSAISISMTALRFIEIENREEEGIWQTFHTAAQNRLEDAQLINNDVLAARVFVENTERFLFAYNERSVAFVSDELQLAEENKADVALVVLIIFVLHIFLFLVSVRLDLQVLSREFER